MYLWATLTGDFDEEVSLNLPSLKKLSKALDMTGEDDLEIKLNSNNLEYKGKSIKFKYHLYDDGILTKPKLSLEKIKSFVFEDEIVITKAFLTQLLKNSAVFNNTNKLYIYTEDDHLVWSLADKTLSNTDALTIVGEAVDFELDTFILNLDNLRLLTFGSEPDITFNINSTIGVGQFQLQSGDLTLNYIVSSLTK